MDLGIAGRQAIICASSRGLGKACALALAREGCMVVINGRNAQALHAAPTPEGVQNTEALGLLIYDKYIYLFQAAGLILLVAMIGAILLTLRHRTDIKRQNVLAQMHRDPAKALELVDVKPGQGL